MRIALLLTLLIIGCSPDATGIGHNPQHISTQPSFQYEQPLLVLTPQWDGPWIGQMSVFLPERLSARPCSLFISSGVVTGNYDGVPFYPTMLSNLADSSEWTLATINLALTDGDSAFWSGRLARYTSFGSSSNVATSPATFTLRDSTGIQSFSGFIWLCTGCASSSKMTSSTESR